MDLKEFLAIAKLYSSLGWSVQEQLDRIMDGDPLDDLNREAVKLISDWLSQAKAIGDIDLADEISEVAEEIDDWLKQQEK